jgi:hypothetical protein
VEEQQQREKQAQEGAGRSERELTTKDFDNMFERYRNMHDVNVVKGREKNTGKNLRFGGYVDEIMGRPADGRAGR